MIRIELTHDQLTVLKTLISHEMNKLESEREFLKNLWTILFSEGHSSNKKIKF